MTTQPNKKQDAPAGTGAPSKAANNHLRQDNYTPSLEDAKKHLEKYLQVLPPEMRASFERFNQDAIRKTLRK